MPDGIMSDRTFVLRGKSAAMPRVSAAHELEVKGRIVHAALRVFAEKGIHRATIQDIVRDSGLSVGAIYSYFKSKDELFLAGCDLSTGQGIGELGTRLASGRTLTERIAISVGYFLDGVDDVGDAPGLARFLVQAWAGAEEEPAVREMLIRRREQLATVGQILIREGIASGDIPAWVDVDGLAFGISAMFDGILLMRIEDGASYRRATAERRIRAVIELIVAVPAGAARPAVPIVAAQRSAALGGQPS
jgi:AcrR family transcriptional regulator